MSVKKPQAIMASTPSKVEPEIISLEEFGRDVERRRQMAGVVDMPRNAGDRRTARKRALLKAIEDVGGKW